MTDYEPKEQCAPLKLPLYEGNRLDSDQDSRGYKHTKQSVYGRLVWESAMAFTLACSVFCGVYGVVYNWTGRLDVCKEVKFLSPSARIKRSRGNVYAGSQWNKQYEVKDYVS